MLIVLNHVCLCFKMRLGFFGKAGEKHSWQDGSSHCYQQPTKTSNGKRFMVIHAGGDTGFGEDAGKVFCCNTVSSDYHDSMDHQYFENWFENCILKSLEEPSLINLDNASYHTRQLNKIRKGSWKKAEIVDWLRTSNIQITGNELKCELLVLVKNAASYIKPRYTVDGKALEYGHEVL